MTLFNPSQPILPLVLSFCRFHVPVDVSHIEDLTDVTRNLGIVIAHEFNLNPSLAQVGAHGEVGDSCDHGDGSSNVVEDTVSAWLGEGETGKDEGRDKHHRAHSLYN